MREAVLFNQALAEPTRWRVAMLVADQMLCVCELEDGLRLPQSTLSSHLAVMRNAGLLEVERQGKWAYYRMTRTVRPLFEMLRAHFAASLEKEPGYRAAAVRVTKRVALRGTSDCGTARRRAIPPALTDSAQAPCC
jgi:ArsR family transcriptional regulator